ncbi:hypothetical protein LCGC14_2659290, partial [marine sediment metagenome]
LVYIGFGSLFALAAIQFIGKGWHEVTIKQFFYAVYFFVAWPVIFPVLMALFFVGLLIRKRQPKE